MTKRLINEQGNTFKVRTPGCPLTLQVIGKKRKIDNKDASSRTKRRRCQELEEHREVAVGARETLPKQLAREVDRLSRKEAGEFLANSDLHKEIKLPNDDVVAMQAHAGLSTTQMRKIKPFLKKNKVSFPEEKKQRELINDITSDFFETCTISYKDKDDIDREVPVCYVKDIEKLVLERLDKLQNNEQLLANGIPDGEIWVKFGGDHGKGSFKFCLQICNVKNPNSKSNAIVILKANVKDTYDTLFTLMTFVSDQIEKLNGLIWKGKKVRVFVCGDYDFYSKIYGIAGATGTHFCLWCDITLKQLQEQGGDIDCTARTIDRINEQNNDYENIGMAQKNVMCNFENCVNRPMLKIEIDHVVPPYLHILLGIMKRHHELLEDSANYLDQLLMKQEEQYTTMAAQKQLATSLRDYGGNWQEAEKLKANKSFTASGGRAKGLTEIEIKDSIDRYNEKLQSLQKTDLQDRQGPLAFPLDDIMKKEKVTVQPYHNRSYLGNDCHTYFTKKVYEKCTEHILTKVKELTTNPEILKEAHTLKTTYDDINSRFKTLHEKVAHSRPIDEGTVLQIDTDIQEYMKTFRQNFEGKCLPKHHILEKHVAPWIAEWKFGLALQGESGLELCHQTLAVAERSARHLRATERGAKLTLERHFVTGDPNLIAARPIKEERLKRRKANKRLFE